MSACFFPRIKLRLRPTSLVLGAVTLAVGWTSTPAANAQDAAPAGADRLVVNLTDVSINKVPYIVAREEGLFKKHGLDVHLQITPGAARTAEGSDVKVPARYVGEAEGRVDISTGGGSPTIVARTTDVRQRDRVIIATTDHVVRWQVFARPGITSLEQLKGKRLGVSGYGSCTGFIGRLIARKMGWDPEQDLSILYGSLGVRWLKERMVDAVILDEMHAAYAVSIGLKPLVDLREWNEPIACSGVSVTQSWLAQPKNRDKGIALPQGGGRGNRADEAGPGSRLSGIGKWYGITDPTRHRHMLQAAAEMGDAITSGCRDQAGDGLVRLP